MKLERMSNGAVEIASPIFHGSITLDAARELAARLTELADEADRETARRRLREKNVERYGKPGAHAVGGAGR